MPDEHSILGPSSAHRWGRCAASLFMEKGEPDTSGEDAALGTVAHDFAHQWLLSDTKPELNHVFDQRMANDIERYYSSIKNIERSLCGNEERRLTHPIATGYEVKVDLSDVIGVAGQFGTLDAYALGLNAAGEGVLVVSDLKYGMGVKVEAEENWQMMLYALGILISLPDVSFIKHVELRIHQVRLNHFPVWETTVQYLQEFMTEIADRAQKAVTIYNTGVVGSDDFTVDAYTCRWCKAKYRCDAYREKMMGSIQDEFDALDTPLKRDSVGRLEIQNGIDKVSEMSFEALGKAMTTVELIKQWAKAVEERAFTLAMMGNKIPGYKIVKGKRGNRRWTDDAAVEKFMRFTMRMPKSAVFESKLITPTKAVKMLSENPTRLARLQEFITQDEGKPSLALLDDPRDEVIMAPVESEFEVIPDKVDDLSDLI